MIRGPEWRPIASAAAAMLIAAVAWWVSPQVLTLLHLDDLELVGRLGVVIVALTAAERVAHTVGG